MGYIVAYIKHRGFRPASIVAQHRNGVHRQQFPLLGCHRRSMDEGLYISAGRIFRIQLFLLIVCQDDGHIHRH